MDSVDAAWKTFETEIEGVEYKSLLPATQQPPVELNRVLMERYRPLMEQHYLQGHPEFS